MSETTPDAAGASSGLLSTSQQVGAAIGLAALSSIAVATTNHLSTHGQTATTSVGGYHLGWGIGAAVLTAAAAIAAMTLTGRRPSTDHEPAGVPADAATAAAEERESVRA